MSRVVRAKYENGVLKLLEDVKLQRVGKSSFAWRSLRIELGGSRDIGDVRPS